VHECKRDAAEASHCAHNNNTDLRQRIACWLPLQPRVKLREQPHNDERQQHESRVTRGRPRLHEQTLSHRHNVIDARVEGCNSDGGGVDGEVAAEGSEKPRRTQHAAAARFYINQPQLPAQTQHELVLRRSLRQGGGSGFEKHVAAEEGAVALQQQAGGVVDVAARACGRRK
jgi:hypothetical protein